MRACFAALGAVVVGAGAPGAVAGQLPANLPAGAYRLEPARSSLVAVTGFFGQPDNVRLRFPALSGQVDYDPGAPELSRVRLEVEVASLHGDMPWITRSVLASLEPGRYPVIRFMSRDLDLRRTGSAQISGELTLHGVTRPVALDISIENDGSESRTLRFTGTGHIRRSDFGVRAPGPFSRDRIDLRFDVTFLPPYSVKATGCALAC